MTSSSPPIRWQVIYSDYKGQVIERGPFTDSDPGLKIESDSDGPGSVMDLIVHVTVRPRRKSIDSESSESRSVSEQSADDEDAATQGRTDESHKITSVNHTVIRIRSPKLIEALKRVTKYDPKQVLHSDIITVQEPYQFLFHHLADLEKYIDENDPLVVRPNEPGKVDSQEVSTANSGVEAKIRGLRHDFRILTSYLETRWEKKIERELERHRQTPPVATFEMLWMLFKPGSRVFAFHENELLNGGWIVRGIKWLPKYRVYKLSLWHLDSDGTTIDRAKARVFLYSFDGEREISMAFMDPCPVELTVDDRTIQLNKEYEKKLIDRGKKFMDLMTKIFNKRSLEVFYDGQGIDIGLSQTKSTEHYNGNTILDPQAYESSMIARTPPPKGQPRPPKPRGGYPPPGLGVKLPSPITGRWRRFFDDDDLRIKEQRSSEIWNHYQQINQSVLNEFPTKIHDGQYFLCPPSIGGFFLGRRDFYRLKVENIRFSSTDENILKSLRIPESNLKLIKALTHKFEDGSKPWSADNIRSKGEGVIFLLHGPSGVGKTYTAECIAMYTRRPLLSLTVADLGTDEAEMESALGRWFRLSETWGAIMLIDEADVYFERRGSNQLQRNSLVSAFLRSMEYYRGILFLTTNRLGHIDDAIISRIHLIIEYKDLTEEDRVKIWKQFFAKLAKDRQNFVVDDYLEGYIESDKDILRLQWNGREIRNAFQTAVALAEYDAKTDDPPRERVIVRKRHLEGVVEMSTAFKQYMENWRGGADMQAYREGARMDPRIRQKRAQINKDRKAAGQSRRESQPE